MEKGRVVKTFFIELVNRIAVHRVGMSSGQIAYFLTLTLFPMLIFINAIIGLLHISDATLIKYLSPFLPAAVMEVLTDYMTHLALTPKVTALSVGAVITLFTASRAVYALTFAVDRACKVQRRRGFIRNNIYAMLFMVGISVTIVVSIVLASFGQNSAEWVNARLGYELFSAKEWGYLRWVIVFAMLLLFLGSLYYFLPNKKLKLSQVLPGTVISMLLWIAIVWGFSVYINNFLLKWSVYGSLGAIIVLMVWLYFMAWIIIVGAEINQIIMDIKDKSIYLR